VPPHRRRPNPSAGQTPPVRRRKVAGLGNRPGHPESAAEQTTEQPAIQPEPEPEQETESVSGVLDGVLGRAPATPATDDEVSDEVEDETDIEAVRAAGAANEPPPVTEDEADEEAPAKPTRKPRPVPAARAGTRPAGKRRSTGSARPDDLASAESDAGTERRSRHARVADYPARTKGQRQLSVAIVLAVVAAALGGLAFFFRGEAQDLTSGDNANTALTDSAATSQIKGQLTTAIKQTFSYNYTDLDSTEKAVKENLVGKALCEYNLLFGEVKEYAPQQKIVLDTTVRELALVRIDGDRAEALVYIDQLSTRVDVNKTVAVGGQFAVQAAKQGDHWKITSFDMFGQPLFNGKPAPKC
jgi:Mce-associated membrane protein